MITINDISIANVLSSLLIQSFAISFLNSFIVVDSAEFRKSSAVVIFFVRRSSKNCEANSFESFRDRFQNNRARNSAQQVDIVCVECNKSVSIGRRVQIKVN